MDQISLQLKADHLHTVLGRHAPSNPDAATLQRLLKPIFRSIGWGLIKAPLEWDAIPGSYFFTEGGLRRIDELSKAYASFKIEITGMSDSPVLRDLKERGPPR